MSLENKAKGAAAGWFQRWMDGFAKKRPSGLVARFRRRHGKFEPQQLEETAEAYVERVKDEYKRRKKR